MMEQQKGQAFVIAHGLLVYTNSYGTLAMC